MKFRGGYNILLEGKPAAVVKRLPEPKELYLPLHSRRFLFSDVRVKDGQRVNDGDILAKDPENYAVPLLAPRGGIVNLTKADGHIVLTDIQRPAEKVHIPEKDLAHIVQSMGSSAIKRYKLLALGAWQFFYDAYTGELPDPLGKPQAIIVSTVSLEPFVARGEVQLKNRLLQFTRGLEHLQSFLEYQPIYLIMPEVRSEFDTLVCEHIRGYAWAKMVEIPMKYPYDNFNILARRLGLKKNAGPVWSVRTEGILAIDRALTVSKPCLVRIISIGGIGVNSPAHLKAMAGYPLQAIIDKYVFSPTRRIINGGIFTGECLPEDILGLDTECRGLTVLPEHTEREFLGFVRLGWSRRCYSGCFLSSLRKDFRERLSTAVRGELRPCVSCNFCEEVCPAGIMPHLIHKYLYRDLIEEVDEARLDLCIECGLCSFVCPSKIELKRQFVEAKKLIEKEKEEIRQEQRRQETIEENVS
ncbi:MAG: 4Fe-4S dicluster domain-containing protein [Planctomycetota bacterium]|jgi:Na+-transporting NADH:ubiquinone oxidoreductase subunit A